MDIYLRAPKFMKQDLKQKTFKVTIQEFWLDTSILHSQYSVNETKSAKDKKRERTPYQLIYKASITQILKLANDTTRKEKHKPISLMNIYVKIFNKIIANWIQQHNKRIIQQYQVALLLRIQGCFNICKCDVIHHINKTKCKNHTVISIDTGKEFDKLQHQFIIKTVNKVGIAGIHLNIIQDIYNKHMANITLNGK